MNDWANALCWCVFWICLTYFCTRPEEQKCGKEAGKTQKVTIISSP